MANDNDWSKPQAMAIPKEGYFTAGAGAIRPGFPQNTRMLRFHHNRQNQAGD